jgi:trehalose 6-phosphate phosphatase
MTENPPELHLPQILSQPLPRDAATTIEALIPSLRECALLFDIDGTLLELAPTPADVSVPPELQDAMHGLLKRTSGALALVSGRSIDDIDTIFAPSRFPAVGGHGAETRVDPAGTVVPSAMQPIDAGLKRRFARIADLSPGILIEDKGYSIALHFRLAPQADESVFAIMPDLGGFAFSVGHPARGVAGHFEDPQHVRRWLRQLLDR